MKKVFVFLLTLSIVFMAYAGYFAQELRNSMSRARDGNLVEYTLHFPGGEEKLFTGADFTNGRIIEQGGAPAYFELIHGKYEKKYNIVISLQNCIYYKLDIEKVNSKWEYRFHFYY